MCELEFIFVSGLQGVTVASLPVCVCVYGRGGRENTYTLLSVEVVCVCAKFRETSEKMCQMSCLT